MNRMLHRNSQTFERSKRILSFHLRRKSHSPVRHVHLDSKLKDNSTCTIEMSTGFVSVEHKQILSISVIFVLFQALRIGWFEGSQVLIFLTPCIQEKNFVCNQCSMAFGTNVNLQAHLRTHSVRIDDQCH